MEEAPSSNFEKTLFLLKLAQQYRLHPALIPSNKNPHLKEARLVRGRITESLSLTAASSTCNLDPGHSALEKEIERTQQLRSHIASILQENRLPNLSANAKNSGKKPKKRTQLGRSAWLTNVRNMSNHLLFSSCVTEVLSILEKARYAYPGEKVMVFSKYLQFLDIVGETIRQQHVDDTLVLCFNGTMDGNERVAAGYSFYKSQYRQTVMLITAGAGGAGLYLRPASVIIQTEPWWVASEEQQVF